MANSEPTTPAVAGDERALREVEAREAQRAQDRNEASSFRRLRLRTPFAGVDSVLEILFGGMFVLVTCLSIFYLAFALYGIARSYALPTTAIFRLLPWTEEIISVEPYFSVLLLVIAASGAVVSWMGSAGLLERTRITSLECRLEPRVKKWGSLTILSLLLVVISSGGWSGRYTGHPSSSWDALNLMPWSDSITYFGSALDRAGVNTWGNVPARRPLAQALRDGLVFLSGYSHVVTILLQTALIAAGITLTAARILNWRGLWAAIAFVGLSLALIREYLGTMMTEPIGYMLALFACAYLCDALRFKSSRHAVIALVGITMGLVARAGSLLTIPFLLLWIVLILESDGRVRMRLAAVGIASVGTVFGLNTLLNSIYSPAGIVSGASISLTLCGLSVGGNWGDCYQRLYGEEIARLNGNDSAIMTLLLRKALENIVRNPRVFLHALIFNSVNYILQLPQIFASVLSVKYSRIMGFVFLILAAGLSIGLLKRGRWREALFWVGFFLSTVASAALIYADDGRRSMLITYLILAVPLALAFSSAVRAELVPAAAPLSWRSGSVCLLSIALFALLAPAASHAIVSRYVKKNIAPISAGASEAILLGRAGISGFLVLPDGAERPIAVPSVHYSDFRRIPQVVALKQDYDVDVDAFRIAPPFAFVIGMRLNESCCYYVTSPAVMLDTAKAWRLKPLEGAQWKPILEMRAEPLN